MKRYRLTAWVGVAIVLAAACGAAAQQSQPLSVQITPVPLVPRSHGPLLLDATVRWTGRDLLRGELELIFADGRDVRGTYRFGPLALPTGEQTFRLLVPPLPGGSYSQYLSVHTRWRAGERVINLPSTSLPASPFDARSFVVARLEPALASIPPQRDSLRLTLGLEQGAPSREEVRGRLQSGLARLTPEAAPHDPLSYCAFDLVTSSTAALNELEPGQREALARWVRGGGGLLIWADAAAEPAAASWLDRLAGAPLPRKPGGHVTLDAPLLLRPDLGTLAVVDGRALPGASSASWRSVLAHLWRLRPKQRDRLLATGRWRDDLEQVSTQRRQQMQWMAQGEQQSEKLPLQLHRLAMPGSETLMYALMPATVRLVPFGLIVAVLVGFTLLIGPAEYLVLGRLRRRRWTWVLFPVVTLAVTLLIVWVSDRSMGRSDHRTRMVITDYGAGGEAVRQNVIELIFAGNRIATQTPVEQALVAPLSQQLFEYDPYMYGYSGYANDEPYADVPPLLRGRPPGAYELVQVVNQWEPRTTRRLAFEVDAAAPLAFEAVDAGDLADAGSPRHRRELAQRLTAGRDFTGSVLVFHRDQWHTLAGDGRPIQSLIGRRQQETRVYYYYPANPDRTESMLWQICARQAEGLFSIVAQTSPCGGSTLEDLAVMDSGAAGEYLVLAVWQAGDAVHVARRLYREER